MVVMPKFIEEGWDMCLTEIDENLPTIFGTRPRPDAPQWAWDEFDEYLELKRLHGKFKIF